MSSSNPSSEATKPQTAAGLDPKADTMAILKRGTFEMNGVSRTSVTLDASSANLATLMDAITSEELTTFVSTIESVQGTEVLALLSSLFDFQGFDPIQIIKKLMAVNKYLQGKNTNPPETSDTLKQDIMMMVCANIIMGNLQVKSVGRRSEKGRAALEYLISKYHIKVGSTGAGLPSDTLTFPRVANSFPVLTCRSANVLPTKTLSQQPFKTNNIPKFMRVSAFASFCSEEMNERTRMFLLTCVCAYSCDHMITVHEGEKKKRRTPKDQDIFSPTDAWLAQWDYILVASTSPVPTLNMKRAMMTEFKLREKFTILSAIYENASKVLGGEIQAVKESEFQLDIDNFVTGKSPDAAVTTK